MSTGGGNGQWWHFNPNGLLFHLFLWVLIEKLLYTAGMPSFVRNCNHDPSKCQAVVSRKVGE
jgi:hypothetical protein